MMRNKQQRMVRNTGFVMTLFSAVGGFREPSIYDVTVKFLYCAAARERIGRASGREG